MKNYLMSSGWGNIGKGFGRGNSKGCIVKGIYKRCCPGNRNIRRRKRKKKKSTKDLNTDHGERALRQKGHLLTRGKNDGIFEMAVSPPWWSWREEG